MSQSQSSIPPATWDYLLQNAPYSSPQAIVRRLKKAPKSVRKKCYDSLPLLVHHLCPKRTVPRPVPFHLVEPDEVQTRCGGRASDCHCAAFIFCSIPLQKFAPLFI